MVKPASLLTCLGVVLIHGPVLAEEPPTLKSASAPPASVRQALTKGGYPWYDSKTDSARPVWPSREPEEESRRPSSGDARPGATPLSLARAGDLIAYALAILSLSVLVAILFDLWRRYRPSAQVLEVPSRGPGSAMRIDGLPEGLRPDSDDPWAEAVACRARGDFARAVVCLFAYELLTLDRLRQVRLAPGLTGRQIVRMIGDAQFRARIEPTLRLFEEVYYGHRRPSADEFGPVWDAAEGFHRKVSQGATP